MIVLSGYIVTAKISESSRSIIYRGIRKTDKQAVVIKLLAQEHPSIAEIARFEQEYHLLKRLESHGTVAVYGFEKSSMGLTIIEEEGGETLQQFLAQKKLTLHEKLTIALKIVEALEKVHEHQIIHKDINSTNILYDSKNHTIKIIDFGLATTLSREVSEMRDLQLLQEGTLYYTSPEQTGRMNRGIDYRTDYYSLGVIFYQMLTGVLPFQAEDVAGLIHAHIAKSPIAPDEVEPGLPHIVSEIVLKLLAKRAEDRYQSTYGLKRDIQHCITLLEQGKENESYVIGQYDISSRFQIQEKLYGREIQLSNLLNTFNKAVKGSTEFILIAGDSGIGKSSLVQELYKPIIEQHGYFVSGKFDQFKRNLPYASLIQAFQALVQQILTESEDKIRALKEKIQQALKQNGRVITEVVPALTEMIGEQPPVQELNAAEAENRFKHIFKNLIEAIAQPEHPLVIFLDDCQWADAPTLNLLEALLIDKTHCHLMIIAAFRDNEIHSNHIFQLTLNNLKKADVNFQLITLPPLELLHVQQLLTDALRCSMDEVKSLAAICYEKTQGNPFFLNQFLYTLVEEQLLEFNFQQGKWFWDIQKIEEKNITNNVVALMEQKVKELTKETQQVLEFAACLGNRFDLMTLAIICEKSARTVYELLDIALKKGLIVVTKQNYQFSHDRVQQAVYSLIPEQQRQQVHLNIGRLLLANTPKTHLEDALLNIVNQINYGIDLITDKKEKVDVANLNYLASKKAKDLSAYEKVFHYCKIAIDLLGNASWKDHYELTYQLYVNAIEVSYLINKPEEMQILSEIALQNVNQLLEKVKIYTLRTRYLVSQHKLDEAVDVGLSALKLLGISFPKHPNNFHILYNFFKIKWLLRGKSMEDLYHYPDMINAQFQEAFGLLQQVSQASYFVDIKLFTLLVIKAVELTLRHGTHPLSTGFYITYATMLGEGFNQYASGYDFVKLTLRLVEKYNLDSQRGNVWMSAALFLSFIKPVSEAIDLLSKAYQKALISGNIDYATFCAICYCDMLFNTGVNLQVFIKEFANYYKIISINKTITKSALLTLQSAHNLMETSQQTTAIVGDVCDENELLAQFTKSNDVSGLTTVHRLRILLACFFNDYDLAYASTKIVANYNNIDQIIVRGSIHLFSAFACLKQYKKLKSSEKKQCLKLFKKNYEKIKKWAKNAPMNALNKEYLLAAEWAKLNNKKDEAADYYEKSILLAQQNNFTHEEALANEHAALYYLEDNKEKIAKFYIQEAHYCYTKWGALAKVQQLEQRFPEMLRERRSSKRASQSLSHDMSLNSMSQTTDSLTDAFDLSSIMKSTQVITHEIDLAELLKKMVRIVIENAGAQKGYFLLQSAGKWLIQAQASIEVDEVRVLQSMPIRNILPENVIQYVVRTHLPVALGDATQSEQFSTDSYIQRVKPKSVLCLPLLNQGVLSGILYLENNLATDTFTNERMNILNVLLGQIVSAIDNAKLYSDLKELNRIQESFVPKEFLNLLGKENITEVLLGDFVQKEMTIMFCDIRNFTTISEQLTPEETMQFINNFLSKMEPMITQHNGVIDKYIGDAIMALFPQSADDAVRCAISMLKMMEQYNAERSQKNNSDDPIIKIGIGLNTGKLVLGTVGTSHRMEGTVLSDAVNIASRIEQLTKTYQTPILITEDTYKHLKDLSAYSIRKVDNAVIVKGKSVPITIYEVFDHEIKAVFTLKHQTKSNFEKAIELFSQQQYKQAHELFQGIVKENPDDLPALLYIERCQDINGSATES